MPTYYISPTGNDADDGLSPTAAWQTLAKASGFTYQTGDVIALEGGQTFHGTLALTEASGYVLRVTSYGSGRAKVQGSVAVTNTSAVIEDLDVDAQGAAVSAIHFHNSLGPTFRTIMPGCAVRRCSAVNAAADADGSRGCGVEFSIGDGLVNGFDHLEVDEVETAGNQVAGVFLAGSDGEIDPATGQVRGTYSFWDPFLRNVRSHDNPGAGQIGMVKGWLSGSGFMVFGAVGGTVTGCALDGNGKAGNLNCGVYVGYSCYLTISHNTIASQYRAKETPDGEGIQLDVRCRGCNVVYNMVTDTAGAGVSGYGEALPNFCDGNVFVGNVVTDACQDDPAGYDMGLWGNASGNVFVGNAATRSKGKAQMSVAVGNYEAGNVVG